MYIDSGDAGKDDLADTLAIRDHLLRLGRKPNVNLFFYTDHGGQHNELSWGQRFWRPLYALFSV